MINDNAHVDRRKFLKSMGAAGLGSVFAGGKAVAKDDKQSGPNLSEATQPQVPRRKLGKTGIDVPVLALGTMYNLIDKQIMLRKTLDWGVNYWDTSYVYAGGNSELGIGKYLSRNPEQRKNVTIVSKALNAFTYDDMERIMQTSLKRMNTDYIDIYYFHALGNHSINDLNDDIHRWAESAKRRKKIRYFGFSTHQKMAQCLMKASKLDWIDVIMTSWNFRLMQKQEMHEALDACHEAGIGLVAMKTTGQSTLKWARQAIETKKDKQLVESLLDKGYSKEQACIKLVLDDPRISSACVGMSDLSVLTSNVAAVLDKTKLAAPQMEAFKQYADATCGGYCAGCSQICQQAVPEMPYVSEIMRYLMYYNNYGDKQRARQLFAQIPARFRNKLTSADYSKAETRCPQQMPIGALMAEAEKKLA